MPVDERVDELIF